MEANTTNICQPCDVAMFCPLKAHMRNIMSGAGQMGKLTQPPVLRANMPHLLADAVGKTCTVEGLAKTWAHVSVEADDPAAVFAEASALRESGQLFGASG
eukprot:5948604-Amphidinium_carterae.1